MSIDSVTGEKPCSTIFILYESVEKLYFCMVVLYMTLRFATISYYTAICYLFGNSEILQLTPVPSFLLNVFENFSCSLHFVTWNYYSI